MNTQNSHNDERFAFGKRFGSTSRVIHLLLIVFATAVVTALVTFSITVNTFFSEYGERDRSFEILSSVIREEGYELPDFEAMRDEALKAYIAASGDLYAQYYTDEEYQALREQRGGNYVGIGVTVREKEVICDGNAVIALEIIRIHKGSLIPSFGVSCGDCIFSIHLDQVEYTIADIGREKAVEMIRGAAETEVEITFLVLQDGAYEKKTVSVTRTKVETLSVEYNVSNTDSSVGIIRIYGFDLTTPHQVCDAVDSLSQMGIGRIVFDLRDNGGGDLWSVVACASYFVNQDDILLTVTTQTGIEEIIRAKARFYNAEYESCDVRKEDIGKYRNLELVVLVNEYTASAAELFTAVLRDYELATIVGTKTYGKGSMQSYFSLSKYGLDGVLKITTNHYLPPCGEDYNGEGIVPEYIVDVGEYFDPDDVNRTEATDAQLMCGIQILTSN